MDIVLVAVKIDATTTIKLLYSAIDRFSCYEGMLQVRKNLSQANGEWQISSPYDRSDGQNRPISLELPKFVRGLSLGTTRHIHHQQTQQR
ncbi:MAG: hypothetical protein NTAFB01_40210 [Nitrospira sp.]